jgi:hypothetical protein
VLEVVDRLLDVQAGDEPVVILQADEGPFPDAYRRNETNFDWLSATPDQVQQKFGILNALYLPGVDGGQAGVTPRLSPVNEFRVVFNAYFDADLPLLPDVTFLSPNNRRWSEFVEYPRP